MNREHKRQTYHKGYAQKHPCPDPFTCRVCGRLVVPAGAGSNHRNHCPNCLASVHLDEEPGDRASPCHGVMDPIAVWVRKKWGMGRHPSVPRLRPDAFQPHRRRRQSHETDGYRHAPLRERDHVPPPGTEPDPEHGGGRETLTRRGKIASQRAYKQQEPPGPGQPRADGSHFSLPPTGGGQIFCKS